MPTRCTSAWPTRPCASARRLRPTCYLNIPNIISAAEIVHADAIHPGYGFLSENAQFAEIVESTTSSGSAPSPSISGTMGDKIEAKRTAAKLGLPLVPGFAEGRS